MAFVPSVGLGNNTLTPNNMKYTIHEHRKVPLGELTKLLEEEEDNGYTLVQVLSFSAFDIMKVAGDANNPYELRVCDITLLLGALIPQ